MSPAAEPALRLPYPGLRSFQRDESDLFFGREGTVNDMINRLRPNHFLAVLGTSGSGKSSLVRIGLLDGLELGLLAEAGSRWRIADFAPGANPVRNLARELVRLSDGSEIDVDFLEAFLRRGPRSLIEWCKDGHLPKGANLLLLVDQFEELFRYQDYAERQAAEAFVALLIESARNREVPIYVVITMRSEYLGACALIEGLAEIINDGQFLTPRLNREQCREAIVDPAAVCGTVIEGDLVNRLLNDLEDFAPWDDRDSGDQLDRLVRRADQLPLLQHTLNRLWLRADAMRADKGQPIVLRLADYDAIGGLRGAINAHADEILAKLTPDQRKRAEQVFRALTDGKSIATAVRRPTRFDELVAICDNDEAGVRAVVDAFRETGVNFLRPDTSAPLKPDTIVDISHESLIRQWRKLSGWLLEEAREAQEWTRLGEAAARYRAGEGSLFYGQDLHQWREHARPTAAWARRYNQPYEETLAFLDQSIHADRRGKRIRTAAIAAAFIVIVGFGGFGGLIWYLVGLNNDLTTQTTALSEATAALETKNLELSAAQADLADSLERLQSAQQALRNVFLGSFDSSVNAYQQSGRWADAGALLGAMLSRTAHSSGIERSYDPAVLSAARMRLAAQSAFPVWEAAAEPASIAPVPAAGTAPANRYIVDQVTDPTAPDLTRLRLVDALTGLVVAETTLPDGQYPNERTAPLVTANGADVVIVTNNDTVVRWRTGEGEIVDYGPLGEAGSAVKAAALDPVGGLIAFILYDEDSEIVVLGSDPPAVVFRAPISGIVAFDDEELASATMNGTGVWFADGWPVVAFEPDGGARRFAVIDTDEESATLLPESVVSVMPSPDGARLFVVETRPPGATGLPLMAGADGRLIGGEGTAPGSAEGRDLSMLGVFDMSSQEVDVLGRLRPGGTSASGGMTLAGVLPLAGGASGEGYRVLLSDAVTDEVGETRLLAVDLVADGDTLAAANADAAAGHGAPLTVVAGPNGPRFVTAAPVEAWGRLPAFTPLKSVAWLDSVTGRTVRVAEVAGATEGWPALAVLPATAPWPSDKLGELADASGARGGDALLVVSGRHAGIQFVGEGTPDLVMREMTFGRECRFASGETVSLARLVPWSAATPVFLGVDAAGRVLRFAAAAGGRGQAGAAGGVTVSCIGRVRADSNAFALADPEGGRVLLQTDPQTFAVLPASVESEKEFNESPKVSLSVPSELAALVPGERPTLASVDRSGHLTVLRADPDWRVVSDMRTVVVPVPADLTTNGDRLLLVGENGDAVVVDLGDDALLPVAAGRVPYSSAGYRLLPDGQTVEALVAGAIWRTELRALPALDELGRYAEAAAGALADSSDQDQVTVGERLVRGEEDAAATGMVEMALGSDALCYLAANGVIEAWKAEAGQGTPGARLTAAREEAEARCVGDSPLAVMGRRLAATPHYISPALDPWPTEWSALLHDSIAGNRLASRAMLVGLSNSADAFAGAAGEWLANSGAAFGLEVSESVLDDAAAGVEIDPALQQVAEEQRESYEPAIHELLGHVAARSGDPDGLRDAWVHFRIAELLYRHQVGRGAEADRTVQLRAALARALPADALLESWHEASRWTADVDTLPVGAPPTADLTQRERIRADAERLAELEAGGDGDAPYRLLQAYLWLNLVEIETAEAPEAAAESYARFADVLTSLPPVSELSPSLVATLSDVGLTLAERAVDASATMPQATSALTPFLLGLAEPDSGAAFWDAASLAAYASTIGSVTALIAADPASVSPEVLERLRFAERRFDHAFRLDDEEARAAGLAALEARLKLLDLLIERDPERWDWLAAKGTTEFWIGYRVHEGDIDERQTWLSAAIRDLSAARDRAGADFPAESTYWLTEARRWVPEGEDTAAYLAMIAGGIEDYARLREEFDSGDWQGPLDRGELLASNTELLAKVADAQAALLFKLADDWEPDDPAVQEQALEGFYVISEWDRIRKLAIEAGSTWSSTEPGYANAPGYLPGVVGGRLSVARNGAPADACDRIASFPADPVRRAAATAVDAVDLDAALPVCRGLWSAADDDPRLSFLFGRLLWLTEDRNGLGLDVLQVAAEGGYAAAFNTLAGYLETPGLNIPNSDAMHLELRFAFAQRAVLAAFDDLYAYLEPLAVTARHRAGLRWLAERAASLGSPEAHIAVAGLPGTSPEDSAYHLEVAALLIEDDDEERAEEIRAEIPPEDYVDAADRAEDEWRVEAFVGVPPDLIDALKGATN